jgi:hypothetical protein
MISGLGAVMPHEKRDDDLDGMLSPRSEVESRERASSTGSGTGLVDPWAITDVRFLATSLTRRFCTSPRLLSSHSSLHQPPFARLARAPFFCMCSRLCFCGTIDHRLVWSISHHEHVTIVECPVFVLRNFLRHCHSLAFRRSIGPGY